MKDKKRKVLVASVAVVLLAVLIFLATTINSSNESFKVNTILLKYNVITGGNLSAEVKITNQIDESQVFNLYFSGLEGIAFLDETQLSLGAKGSATSKIYFKDMKNEVNVYVGYLVIETSDMVKKIPVILTVEDINPFFTIIQKPLPKYEDVSPGGKIGMEIELFNLKSKESQNLAADYEIKNFDGETLFSEHENIVVEDKAVISKIINTPENMNEGDYVFITSVNHNGKSVSAYYFQISEKKNVGTGFSLGNSEYFILLAVAGLVFVGGMFWLIFLFFSSRDKLILQLQRQQWTELKQNLNVIKTYKRELKNIEDISERRIRLERLEAQKRRVIEIINLKHEKQKVELKRCLEIKKMHEQKKENGDFKKLRERYERQKENFIKLKEREKRKKLVKGLEKKYARQREYYGKQRQLAKQKKIEEVKKTMAEKLKQWQKQGYAMSELKTHIKGIPSSQIINQVESWKKEGYVLK